MLNTTITEQLIGTVGDKLDQVLSELQSFETQTFEGKDGDIRKFQVINSLIEQSRDIALVLVPANISLQLHFIRLQYYYLLFGPEKAEAETTLFPYFTRPIGIPKGLKKIELRSI